MASRVQIVSPVPHMNTKLELSNSVSATVRKLPVNTTLASITENSILLSRRMGESRQRF